MLEILVDWCVLKLVLSPFRTTFTNLKKNLQRNTRFFRFFLLSYRVSPFIILFLFLYIDLPVITHFTFSFSSLFSPPPALIVFFLSLQLSLFSIFLRPLHKIYLYLFIFSVYIFYPRKFRWIIFSVTSQLQ